MDPVFVSDNTTLRTKLRLSGVADADASAVIEDCISDARLELFASLGETRIAEILLTTPSSNPTTLAQRERLKAERLETKIAKFNCIKTLPLLFANSSSNAEYQISNSPFFRDYASADTAQIALECLAVEISDLKSELVTKTDDVVLGVQASVIGPDTQPPLLADTFYGSY